jgi:4-amino-4-deoxy-L-arabinose transferase-like glycosyltransferase
VIALAEPAVAAAIGPGPEAWRIAAQAIAAFAAILLILPVFVFTESLFGKPAAALAALLWVILPVPAAIGRDTLSDSLALCAFGFALCWGENALRTRRLAPALGCALAAGLGYWTRPEVAILPLAVLLIGLALPGGWGIADSALATQPTRTPEPGRAWPVPLGPMPSDRRERCRFW